MTEKSLIEELRASATKGSEIIKQSDDLEANETEWGSGIIKKNIFLKDSIRDKIVLDPEDVERLLSSNVTRIIENCRAYQCDTDYVGDYPKIGCEDCERRHDCDIYDLFVGLQKASKPLEKPSGKTEEQARFRKVKVLQGDAKISAMKQGLKPDDLVVVRTSVEKVEGDAVSYLMKAGLQETSQK